MGNSFLNTSWISMDVLRVLINKLEVGQWFNTDWDKEFHQDFAVGSSVQVKLPQRFLIRNGLGYNPQAINRLSTTINLDQVFGTDFEWDSYEKAVKMERSVEELRTQYLYPAAQQLAQEVDSRCALFAYQNTPNVFGILGTDSTTVATYFDAERRLFDKACPAGERGLIVSSKMMASFAGNQTTLFNPPSEIARQYKTGVVGQAGGWEWYRSNSLYSHTAGTWAGSVTVTGANQSGSSLIITGTANDTIKRGDMFTIANVNFVNPSTRRAPGPLTVQQFVSLNDYTLSGSADTISIYPAIKGPGDQYQNVDALPANSAALTLWTGTSSPNGKSGTQGLGLSKYAFALAGAKLETPSAVEVCTQTKDPQTSMGVRFIRQFDGFRSVMINRFDMAIGFGVLYGENGAVRVVGA